MSPRYGWSHHMCINKGLTGTTGNGRGYNTVAIWFEAPRVNPLNPFSGIFFYRSFIFPPILHTVTLPWLEYCRGGFLWWRTVFRDSFSFNRCTYLQRPLVKAWDAESVFLDCSCGCIWKCTLFPYIVHYLGPEPYVERLCGFSSEKKCTVEEMTLCQLMQLVNGLFPGWLIPTHSVLSLCSCCLI